MGDEFAAIRFNEAHPVGTPVRYWPGVREGDGIESVTRTPAWLLGSGHAVVSVEGYAGGIALTHISTSIHSRSSEEVPDVV